MKTNDIVLNNILKSLEDFLITAKKTFDTKTHEEMVAVFINQTTQVLDNHRKWKAEKIGATEYKQSLLKLAEIILMAVRKLPN